MKTFEISNVPWRLPNSAKLILKTYDVFNIRFKDKTLYKLLDHLQKPTGVWDPDSRWEPLHLTLGDNNKYDQEIILKMQSLYEIFNKESSWYVQLVERIPKVDNPKNKLDYEYRWLQNQRTRLYTTIY